MVKSGVPSAMKKIKVDEKVTIEGIDGVKLIVRKGEE